jgi:nitrite reductase (NADH) small subunit
MNRLTTTYMSEEPSMSNEQTSASWMPVCALDDIVPNTGVCALVNGEQVAVFHVADGEGGVFASPIYKHHFDLRTGECLEAPENSVSAYPVRVESGKVWVAA